MTVQEVITRLNLQLIAGAAHTSTTVTGAQVCDLLSHVMARGQAGQIWITIQTHANIVAVAALARLAAVIVADGCQPEEETIERAEEEGIPLAVAQETAFTVAGRLWELGIR